ncbi:Copper amine oxidase [Metarhizium album ARSEF 1941]|uniref:Amine oxidase n=1 Tax=Metarhizium album (strain ARSEF 1941) TaxID=1081103 RepID=A0A0B2X2L7_METAS|nr:Copper amine oxidase [Metarhizium album ARSEF 1941]KHO00534.1 Copper amine oxidase [Metarhizium album ARSEF 1941]
MIGTLVSCMLDLASWLSSYGHDPWGVTPLTAQQRRSSLNSSVCEARQPSVSAPHGNIWAALTDKEAADVVDLLRRDSTGLNLTAYDSAGSWDNKILLVELLLPNKSDALPLLNNKTTKAPRRCARATLMFGATPNPYLQDYVIGPLPVTNMTEVQPLRFLYNNAGKGRVAVDFADGGALVDFANGVGLSVADITKLLWNATLEDTLSLLPGYPPLRDKGRLTVWYNFVNQPASIFDTETILPLGWHYNGIFYPTADAFRAAATSANFTKLGANVDGPWAQLDKQGDPMKFDNQPPPTPVMPGPNRFSVDSKESYVEWNGFYTKYVMLARAVENEHPVELAPNCSSTIHQLGLQEALAHYAGNEPAQSGTIYFDSKPGVGPSVVSLVDGYDCPTYSTYLNATYQEGERSYSRANAICLFEFDQGYPMHRHSAAHYTTVTKNIAFTVRSVSTIANYDYMFSYNFFLDGGIEVSVRASGYILGGFSANNEDYGWKIHDHLSGSIHDHVLTYKADIDILGEKNSLQKVEFVRAVAE